MSINKAFISGNLTRDPELRSTASGLVVLAFGVAVNDRRKNNQTGEWEDHPNFIDCTMFGTRAESLSRYLSKGAKVSIEGKLRWSQWESDGQKRSKIEVIVDEIEFMSQGQQQGGYQQPQGCAPRKPQQPQAQQSYYAAPQPQCQQQLQQYQQPRQYRQSQQYQQPQQYVPQQPQPELYDEDIPF